MDPSDFQAALRALRDEYAHNLPTKLREVEETWRTLTKTSDSEQFTLFIRLAHSLAGSGETYGFSGVTRTARALEHYAKTMRADMPRGNGECAEIEQLIAALQDSAKP